MSETIDTTASDDWAAAMAEQTGGETAAPARRAPTAAFEQFAPGPAKGAANDIDLILDIPVQLTVELGRSATPAEINGALKEAANGKMKGVLQVMDEELVSIDFRGNPHSSIVDAPLTKVVDGNLAKVFSWYDNEWGFSSRMKDLLLYMAQRDRSAS